MNVFGVLNSMKWPWQTGAPSTRLVISGVPGEVAYVQARHAEGAWVIERLGTERQGDDSESAFHKRLGALGLHEAAATVVLRPSQYQLLQIEAPAVTAAEMRSAVRWQIASMIEQPLEQLVLDVMPVGDEAVRKTNQVFVAAADQSVIDQQIHLAHTLGATVSVIDIQDTAQRNLQLNMLALESAQVAMSLSGATDQAEIALQPAMPAQTAHAALVMLEGQQALFTISALGELQYSRRIDTAAASSEAARERWAMEIQRSLDVWDRTAPMLPIGRLALYAADSTGALSRWLGQYLGQAVYPMEPEFSGLTPDMLAAHPACWPLLGGLLRETLH